MRWPDLDKVLSGLPWAVAGAVATRRYMPERATADIDVVVAVADADDARRRFEAAGYARVGDPAIGGTAWKSPDGVAVNLIEGTEPWWPAAIADAQRNSGEDGLPVLTLP